MITFDSDPTKNDYVGAALAYATLFKKRPGLTEAARDRWMAACAVSARETGSKWATEEHYYRPVFFELTAEQCLALPASKQPKWAMTYFLNNPDRFKVDNDRVFVKSWSRSQMYARDYARTYLTSHDSPYEPDDGDRGASLINLVIGPCSKHLRFTKCSGLPNTTRTPYTVSDFRKYFEGGTGSISTTEAYESYCLDIFTDTIMPFEGNSASERAETMSRWLIPHVAPGLASGQAIAKTTIYMTTKFSWLRGLSVLAIYEEISQIRGGK